MLMHLNAVKLLQRAHHDKAKLGLGHSLVPSAIKNFSSRLARSYYSRFRVDSSPIQHTSKKHTFPFNPLELSPIGRRIYHFHMNQQVMLAYRSRLSFPLNETYPCAVSFAIADPSWPFGMPTAGLDRANHIFSHSMSTAHMLIPIKLAESFFAARGDAGCGTHPNLH